MNDNDTDPLRELLYRACVRFLTVRPAGFELGPKEPLRKSIKTRILGYGGARSHYLNRKPHCRSLDGIHPLKEPERNCVDCKVRGKCTPQVRVDLLVDGRPFRMLLSYTSARSFLLYEADLRRRGISLDSITHTVSVTNRGSWGELRFGCHN